MVSLSHRCLASVLARPFGRGDLTELDSVRSWRNIQLPCGCGVSGTHLEIGDWGLLPVWGFQNMYMYMYMCMCMCMCICLYVCMYVCLSVCLSVCMYVCMCIYIYTIHIYYDVDIY